MTALVTGASRGIGLALVQQLLSDGCRVIATCREPAGARGLQALESTPALTVLPLDVADAASVARLVDTLGDVLGDAPLDALVNNAGVMFRRDDRPAIGDAAQQAAWESQWSHSFSCNTLGPLRVSAALKPFLARSTHPRVLTVSSQMGSLERAGTGSLAYRCSKAAVNMAMRSLAQEWRDDGIIVTLCHPGWVRTEMGGSDAALSVTRSAADLAVLLHRLGPDDSGQFLDHDGSAMPW